MHIHVCLDNGGPTVSYPLFIPAQVTPKGTYHQLKLAMLLSLVCCGAEDLCSLTSDLNTTLSISCSPSQLLVAMHYVQGLYCYLCLYCGDMNLVVQLECF